MIMKDCFVGVKPVKRFSFVEPEFRMHELITTVMAIINITVQCLQVLLKNSELHEAFYRDIFKNIRPGADLQ